MDHDTPAADRSFEQTLARLIAFVTTSRRWPVSSSNDRSERRLAMWCGELQRRHLAHALPADVIARVETVPGWTWSTPTVPVPYPSDREQSKSRAGGT